MNQQERMNWFSEARYGLFIHWGLYSELAGYYKGERYHQIAEWIMKYAQIPLREYRKLADSFNPVHFNARTWVDFAKRAGVKYICITSKHHDGFALFDSKASAYNIMNTPFHRDVIRELSDECHRQGMRFCVYYSQMQDWEDPDGNGNTWDYNPEEQDFNRYFENKVKPQVRELLTNYGQVDMIWFDTPYDMPRQLCEDLKALVLSLQPNCLINGRIGYNLGDFREMADNEYPVLPLRTPWESPITLNDTWGYSRDDQNWKQPETIVRALADVVGKGGNLLVNVGPDPLGDIPEESIRILSTVGKWLEKNGESIYGKEVFIDYPYQIHWGAITAKGNKLYMHLINTPNRPHEIVIWNLMVKVKRAYLLETGEEVNYRQWVEVARDEDRLNVVVPIDQLKPLDTVIVIECEDTPYVRDLTIRY